MKRIESIFVFIFCLSTLNAQNFITRWNLAITGSGSTQIYFTTTNPSGSISYTWQQMPSGSSGSGTFAAGSNVLRTISGLPSGANIRLEISPTNLQRFYIASNADRNRLIDIEQWGTAAWTSMSSSFEGCTNINVSASDAPILNNSSNFSLQYMFYNCINLNSSNLNTWNVSYVTNFSNMLFNCSSFNQPLNNWGSQLGVNTGSNSITLNSMFRGCSVFNQDLSSWDVSKVNNLSYLFYDCIAFNNLGQPGIANWSLGSNSIITPTTHDIVSCIGMFGFATSFNQNINNWDVSKVTDFSNMFISAATYNQPMNNWGAQIGANTGSAYITMSGMFRNADAFNQDLSDWDVTKVSTFTYMFFDNDAFNNANQPGISNWSLGTSSLISPSIHNIVNCQGMFYGASVFNQNINNWNISKVTDFGNMFQSALSYNQPMNNWGTQFGQNTGNAYLTMTSMFRNADAFNQDLSNWDVSKVSVFSNMFFENDIFNNAGQPGISSWSLGTNSLITPSTTNIVNCQQMFYNADAFNQNINNWNVTKVTDFTGMFWGADVFNQPLNNWSTQFGQNTGNAYLSMGSMFRNTNLFNQDLSSWDVSKVCNFSSMFSETNSFNNAGQPGIANWSLGTSSLIIPSTNNLIDCSYMFFSSQAFNQNINNWNISKVTNFESMFNNADAFNQPLNNWGAQIGLNTGATTITMSQMFRNNGSFNQDIRNWDISKVTTFSSFLSAATSFNKNLANWAPLLRSNVNLTNMFDNSGMSIVNYDSTLTGWNDNSTITGRTLGALNIIWCKSIEDRFNLVLPVIEGGKGWTIVGDNTCGPNGVTTTALTTWMRTNPILYKNSAGETDKWHTTHGQFLPLTVPAGATKPSHLNNGLNFHNSLSFNNNTDALSIAQNLGGTASSFTFTVTSNYTADGKLYGRNNGTSGANAYDFGASSATQITSRGASSVNHTLLNSLLNKSAISLIRYTQTNPGPISTKFNDTMNGNYSHGTAWTLGTGQWVLGSDQNLTGNNPSGIFELSEVINYSNLTGPQEDRIITYLGLKYGITLGTPTRSFNYISGLNGATTIWNFNASYHYNIFGIGMYNDGFLDQRISKSQHNGAQITISTDNNFTDQNYSHTSLNNDIGFIMFGNTNHSNTAIQNTNYPVNFCGERLSKQWRVQSTNFTQAIHLKSELAALILGATVADDIVILIDEDGDGDFTSGNVREIAANSLSGSDAIFNSLSFNTDGGAPMYDVFTFAIKHARIPELVPFGQTKTPLITCLKPNGYENFKNPINPSKSLIAFNSNGNSGFSVNNITIDHSGSITPGSVTSQNGYYQLTDGINTMRISNRIISVTAPGTFTTNGGVIIRIYYDPTELLAMQNDAAPNGTIQNFGWYKIGVNNASDVVNALSGESINGGTNLTPTATGTENGISYVEFTVETFSSFGFFAKTTLTPLPINFLEFEAKRLSNNSAILNWQVNQEMTTKYFEVERSLDGINFIKIGSVNGNGSTAGNYQFIDNNIAIETTKAFYRIKLIDENNAFKSSNIQLVHFGLNNSNILIYPNPLTSELNIELNIEKGETVNITITDMMGKTVFSSDVYTYKSSLDLSALSNGLYTISIQHNGVVENYKIVKQ